MPLSVEVGLGEISAVAGQWRFGRGQEPERKQVQGRSVHVGHLMVG
jgi:hypothetical protein